ncbi:ABC transporter substrate-binding protein [soil metagenome]
MKARLKWLVTALLVTMFVSVQAQDEIVIGWSGAVTGPTSDAGQFVIQGVEDYCQYANEESLIPEHTIRCITKDDGYDNDNSLRNFESYLDEDMDAFISYATGATLQLKVNAVEEEIPVISASLHIGVIDPPDNAYNFLPITSYSEQVVALLEYVAQNHEGDSAPKVAMLVHPSAFGRAPVEDAQKAAAELGVDIFEVQEHGEGLDYTAMLQRWDNGGVQYVIGQSVQSPIAALLNTASDLGLLDKMTFMGAHYTGGNTLTSLAGDAAEGFLWATSFELASQIDFQRELGERYGRGEETISDVNYTTGLLQAATFIEAARRAAEAGEVSSATIYEQLLAMNEEGAGTYDAHGFGVGPVSYSESDRVGVDALELFRVENGAFVSFSEPFNSETFRTIHPAQ